MKETSRKIALYWCGIILSVIAAIAALMLLPQTHILAPVIIGSGISLMIGCLANLCKMNAK